MKKFARLILFSALFTACAGTALAQNESGLRAPANVRVDGKLREWTSPQELNKGTNLYYTVANDDEKLYLVLKSADQSAVTKIMGGGITLTVNTDGKKKDKDAAAITFPVAGSTNMRNMRGGFRNRQSNAAPDSATIAGMRTQAQAFKEIKVAGIKAITDSLISIYNTDGIKAAINFDEKGNLTYEMAVPLKLLELSITDTKEIAYNIKVNGIKLNMGGGFGGGNGGVGFGGRRGNGGGFGGGDGQDGGGGGFSNRGAEMMAMFEPADFWGKYKLAKR